MKVLVLTSGGDAPGMNEFIYKLYKTFKRDVFFAYAGFTGLVNGQIYPLADVIQNKNIQYQAGSVIKSSRCPEFKEPEVFAMGLENAKDFDVVIILGGNGSERGAKQLYENGVNTIFVPGTIDNDVDDCFYTIGFDTAVNECVYAIKNSMPSIIAFNNSCLFEVMGREKSAICQKTAELVNADYSVCDKKSLNVEKLRNLILQKQIKNESTCIVVRENIMPIDKIAKKLNVDLGQDIVKYHVVGRPQRGGTPTKKELCMATKFAKETIRCIRSKVYGVRILADENLDIVVKEFK